MLADERHYEHWGLMSLESYPWALNISEIESQLAVPVLLQDIYQLEFRSPQPSKRGGCNIFDTGISYTVEIDEQGAVVSAKPFASDFCCGGEWETYPPFLKQLRFEPGRVSGSAVESSAVVLVQHTFKEG